LRLSVFNVFSTFDKIFHLLLAQIQAFFFISRFYVFFKEPETSMGIIKWRMDTYVLKGKKDKVK